jgi:hypothetical protein
MPSKTMVVKIFRKGSTRFIPVNFDPKAAFGKIRAPVKVGETDFLVILSTLY